MAPDETSGEFDPEEDLLARYETMVQTQVETLDGIDDKAAYTARLVGILAGFVISGVSIVVGTHGSEVSVETGAVFLMLALSVICLFVSLAYAFITYLSGRFEYGPGATLGTFMADYQVDVQNFSLSVDSRQAPGDSTRISPKKNI